MTAQNRPGPPFHWRWAKRLEPLVRHPLAILGVAAVAASLCGLVLNPRGLALAAGLLCVMALGIAWPWISLRGLQGTVSFEKSHGREGQPLAARLTFRNRAPWAAWGLALRFGPNPQSATTHLAFSHLPGWRQSRFDWTFTPDRRGEHPARAWVASGFPFGLRESARSLAVEKPVLVWPLLFPVGPVPEEAGGDDSEGSSLRDRPGDAGDLLGVRFYRRGDPLRRVHWAQTARHGELIVCERQSASSPRVQIVLDTDPAAHSGTGPQDSLEWAIRVAASLLDDWIGQGAETELLYADRAFPARGGTLTARRASVLDTLARLEPVLSPPLDTVLDSPSCRRFGRGLRVVVCTDRSQFHRARAPGGVTERFIVLVAAAFETPAPLQPPLDPRFPVRPWVVLDNPAQIPQQFARQRREASHVR